MNPTSRPAVQRLGSAVLLQGAAVVDTHYLLALGIRQVMARDGIRPGPQLQFLLDELARAANEIKAMSDVGSVDVREHQSQSQSDPTEVLTTREVAVLLDITPRQVTRRALELRGRRSTGGHWLFERGAVDSARSTTTERKSA